MHVQITPALANTDCMYQCFFHISCKHTKTINKGLATCACGSEPPVFAMLDRGLATCTRQAETTCHHDAGAALKVSAF